MYKYCREIMWSVEDHAFVATVVELPGCKAVGKNVVEVVKNLDTAIEGWIEAAEGAGRAIPGPLYYEPTDIDNVPEDEKMPYYDCASRTWKVVTECGMEEGDAIYIASEFVKGGLIYPFHSEPPEEQYPNHTHAFSSVVEYLLKKPRYFSIEGFEEYYSKQERELLEDLKKKLACIKESGE